MTNQSTSIPDFRTELPALLDVLRTADRNVRRANSDLRTAAELLISLAEQTIADLDRGFATSGSAASTASRFDRAIALREERYETKAMLDFALAASVEEAKSVEEDPDVAAAADMGIELHAYKSRKALAAEEDGDGDPAASDSFVPTFETGR